MQSESTGDSLADITIGANLADLGSRMDAETARRARGYVTRSLSQSAGFSMNRCSTYARATLVTVSTNSEMLQVAQSGQRAR